MSTHHKAAAGLLVITLCFAAFFFVKFPSETLSGKAIELAPQVSTVEVGEQVRIDIRVSSVSDLYGLQTDILYDPSIMQFDSLSKGAFLDSNGAAMLLSTYDATSAGTIKNVIIVKTGTNGVSGSGTVLSLFFTGKAEGIANVAFNNLLLTNSNATLLSESVTNTQITVEQVQNEPPPNPPPPSNSTNGTTNGTNSTNNTINTTLTISSITASSITQSSAIIKWNTNLAADSVVEYGASTTLGQDEISVTLKTSHSVSLTNLNSQTKYYYRVNSCTSSGTCLYSAQGSFTTTAGTSSSTGSGGGGGGGGGSIGTGSSSNSGSTSGGSVVTTGTSTTTPNSPSLAAAAGGGAFGSGSTTSSTGTSTTSTQGTGTSANEGSATGEIFVPEEQYAAPSEGLKDPINLLLWVVGPLVLLGILLSTLYLHQKTPPGNIRGSSPSLSSPPSLVRNSPSIKALGGGEISQNNSNASTNQKSSQSESSSTVSSSSNNQDTGFSLIDEYVKHQRESGVSDEDIKSKMRQAGWNDKQIEIYFTIKK